MTNTDKTDRNKEEIELWESITKNDKKYKKNNYFSSTPSVKKNKITKKKPNLNFDKVEMQVNKTISSKHIKKEEKLEKLYPDKIPSGISLRQAENLKRGKLKPEIIIDLHGYTAIQAKDHIRKIVYEAYTNNIRCLLVITGKKFGPQGAEGILKKEVPGWLNTSPLREMVLMTSWATSQHGGEGALYVLLKNIKRARVL